MSASAPTPSRSTDDQPDPTRFLVILKRDSGALVEVRQFIVIAPGDSCERVRRAFPETAGWDCVSEAAIQ